MADESHDTAAGRHSATNGQGDTGTQPSNLGSQPIYQPQDDDRNGQTEAVTNLFAATPLPDLREGDDVAANPDAKSRAEFTTVYDTIDRLEASLAEAKGSLFAPGMVKVDRDEFSEQLDLLKSKLPVQLERASSLMRESERRLETAQSQSNAIIASAQSRAADMVKEAHEQAEFLAGQENVTELARQKARVILDKAQETSDRLTQGANQYCSKVMGELQDQLGKLGHDVQAGLDLLDQRQQEAGEVLPHLEQHDYPEA